MSALVVNQRSQILEIAKVTVRHQIRYLHRYPLGTPCPEIVESIRGIMAQIPEARDKTELWIARPVWVAVWRTSSGLQACGLFVLGSQVGP